MPEETGVIEVRIETPQGFVGLEWNLELVMSMASGDDIEQPWRLHGELDWDHWHSLSVLSAAFEDESIVPEDRHRRWHRRRRPLDRERRAEGRDWPVHAETMVGLARPLPTRHTAPPRCA